MTSASLTPLGDPPGGEGYLVHLEVEARKLRADGQGNETEIDVDDWIDIGVFAEEEIEGKIREKTLFLQKRRITGRRLIFEVLVDERPIRAGIDPFNKLIDRDSDDNVKKVTENPAPSRAREGTGS